jgi:hypothetical protein
MGLNDFFRVNMPYGLKKNSKKEWIIFNREYMPLGWNTTSRQENIYVESSYSELPVYTTYRALTDKKIASIVDEAQIRRNEDGTIHMFFLYNDKLNPQSTPAYWGLYLEKIKALSKLSVRHGDKE